MKQALVGLICVAALAAAFAGGAAARMAVANCNAQLAPRAELACAHANLKHANDVLRFVDHHPSFGTARSRRRVLRDHHWLRSFGLAHVAEANARLNPWPPHHALWGCIERGEAGWHQPSNAKGYVDGVYTSLYWGGMQMHADWGYGTSHHASDDSQLTQEWAAERAYRASDFSRSFLIQQWAADAGCF